MAVRQCFFGSVKPVLSNNKKKQRNIRQEEKSGLVNEKQNRLKDNQE